MDVVKDGQELLARSDFDGCRIEKVKLKEGESICEKYFGDTVFVDCDLSRCDLSDNTFYNCSFVNCDLSLSRFANTVWDEVTFTECRLIGIDWTLMKWAKVFSKKRPKFPVSFMRSTLNFSIFVGLNLHRVSFVECVIKEACFEDAYLGYASFVDTDLSLSTFHNTLLEKADLSTARNYSINACSNVLTKAKFSFPEASSLIYALDIEVID